MKEDYRKIELIMELRNHGIKDKDVLSAIERIPRDVFVPPSFSDNAYKNQALPIECGQTISQPLIVAYMTQQLNIGKRDKVLEIGTGSGYQAAILSQLARRVYSIERYRTLLKDAEKRFDKLDLFNITTMVGDGSKGWEQQAPFDRILLTAAADQISPVLLGQLKDSGIMIAPITLPGGEQELIRIVRNGDNYDRQSLIPVKFVPLVEGVAKEL